MVEKEFRTFFRSPVPCRPAALSVLKTICRFFRTVQPSGRSVAVWSHQIEEKIRSKVKTVINRPNARGTRKLRGVFLFFLEYCEVSDKRLPARYRALRVFLSNVCAIIDFYPYALRVKKLDHISVQTVRRMKEKPARATRF